MKPCVIVYLLTGMFLFGINKDSSNGINQNCPILDAKLIASIENDAKGFISSTKDDECLFSVLDSLTTTIIRQKKQSDFNLLSSICRYGDGILAEQVDILADRIFRAEPDFFIQYCLDKPSQPCIYNSLLDEISASIATYRKDQRQTQIDLYVREMETIINTKPNAKRNLEFFRTKIVAKIDPAKFD